MNTFRTDGDAVRCNEHSRFFLRSLAGITIVAVAISGMLNQRALAGAPSNDDCSDASNVGLGEFPFTTADATTAGPGVCVNFGKDVWFKHRARFTGMLQISLCDAANFDTVIAVYRGTSCVDATLIANMIGCNDDKTGCDDGTSELKVNVTFDQVYLIRIGGFNADSGTGVLTLECGDAENAACAHIIKTGNANDDRLGYALADGGLMNGDNKADIVVGAYRDDDNGSNAGAAYAFQGEGLTSLYAHQGDAAGDNFGFSVATGDINNDGRTDYIVGAPLNDDAGSNTGKVYAFDGFTGNLLWTAVGQSPGDRFGYSVAVAGDIDDDGTDDVIVGAPYNDARGTSSGRAYVLDGDTGNRIRTHTGEKAGDQFGFAVSTVFDLNDDDHDDYIIGEPRNDKVANDAGRATIYNGDTGKVLIRLTGDSAGDRFGSAIAAKRFTATFDYTFILIGAPFNDFGGQNVGRARLFSRNHDTPDEFGCNKLVCLRYTFNGTNANGRLGSSVALGDLVGNSAADALIGAPFTKANGNKSGAVFLFDGNGGTLSRRFLGEKAGDRFGTAVAFAGDIDNDGENDVVIGSPFQDSGGVDAGRAYAFLFGSGAGASVPRLLSPMPGDPIAPTVPPSNEVTGDATLDGIVNVSDVIAVVGAWGPCGATSACHADVDRNGRVDVDDLMLVIASMTR